jgi:hypothetical protein
LISSASTVTVSAGAILSALRIILTGASLTVGHGQGRADHQRRNGDRSSGRERQAERGGDFSDQPPTY